MEIEIGEYVRTKYGIIFTYDKEFKQDLQAQDFSLHNDGKIVKHSKNILDLIEAGDILRYKSRGFNSERLAIVKKYYDTRNNKDYLTINGYKLEQVEILEILTKEQFKANSYVVEMEDKQC